MTVNTDVVLPRYNVYLDVQQWRKHQSEKAALSNIPGYIEPDTNGHWAKWKEVQPYVEYALKHGMTPIDYTIPDGKARGCDYTPDPFQPLIGSSGDEEPTFTVPDDMTLDTYDEMTALDLLHQVMEDGDDRQAT